MRAHEVVLHRIEQDLAAARLRVGDRLPAERALAEDLGVGRSSVREAIRVLEAMGVVKTSVGSGPDAGAIVVADPATSIGSALRLHMATQFLPIADVVQTRVLLESWALREAAARTPDLTTIDELLDRMDDKSLAPDQFHRLDAELHVRFAGLAGNVLIEAMMTSLRDSIHGYVMDAVPMLDDWSAVAVTLRCEHRGIVDALRRGHGAKAATLAREHIEGFYGLMRLD
ncbi:FadR family transcriptional regulator [Rhodococcus sp. BP-349]|uniref:FadR/GntR family transcriptional regulator n=1 Tax=unclassified Rhodococcus (in: high G+C Gram-positive bacteria) TaxID=192944 RepID=UPI001C9B241B|nr:MULTISPECIES: FCD domain-containing protein [unclassified Rhodococcus (in: high G+C Gram-positive bacteria)]MBY6540019.1 FadR family transcriptional regulator [Rhodococcus sp. BP-363]MBY6543653.1 FadR family transcriptional regulator [Rhodococcus sp. BP-369]MBY6562883.1 FadR family transcriptional regulator [Rhodococcus sp. BP-370]MBY6577175.1 FadR family transcriptional regulator [Rhodococcus sp. BP-364]MBY6586476.1 FadR family transcriptional regulator [Rhodococcus sp. BP-358]